MNEAVSITSDGFNTVSSLVSLVLLVIVVAFARFRKRWAQLVWKVILIVGGVVTLYAYGMLRGMEPPLAWWEISLLLAALFVYLMQVFTLWHSDTRRWLDEFAGNRSTLE